MMVKKTGPINTLQQRLTALQQQKHKLEAKRDHEILKIIHKTKAYDIDLITLAGIILEAHTIAVTNPSQMESWRQAGEMFLYPKRAARAANLKSKIAAVSPQKLATAQAS
jgi:hypothetical protein